ncbi:MAG: tRNA lysidine(34) synthetase TilS [Thauera sp.]|nr:tRNA lysidine(34) synthetase TilS [Thauera sp.]
MLDAVASVLAEAGVASGSRLCCCLSGGVDSIVLLQALCDLQPRIGFELVAAHVHHGLSQRANEWLAFCREQCAQRGVVFLSFHVSVRRDDPQGLEAAARAARHSALASIDCDWLVFGHHQDDQAETLLFRLFRGAGVRGAAAMASIERPAPDSARGRLRPLLGMRRAQIEACAAARTLVWVDDESNADLRFARNDIRHRVLPAIEQGFPAAVPALARAAAHFREASDLLDELAEIDEAGCGGAVLARDALLRLSDARIANLLRWQARRRGVQAPTRALLGETVRQLREAGPSKPLRMSLADLACCVYRGRVWLEPALSALATPGSWHGEAALPWAGGRVEFCNVTGAGLSREKLERAASVRLAGRSAGLRLRLGAGRPSRSFKNLCQEAGVPAWLRERLPVLEVDGVAAWVGGIGVAAEFACADDEAGIEPQWSPLG